MKGKLIVGMILLLVTSLVLGGCGISQEVYNAVVAERDAAVAQVQKLQSDLSAAQGQVTKLEGDLSAAQSQVETLESDFSGAQGQVETLESELSAVQDQVTKVESDLSAAQAEFRSFKSSLTPVWTSLEKKLDCTLLFIEFFNEAEKSEYGLVTEEQITEFAIYWLISTGGFVDAVGDAKLSQQWQDFWNYAAQEDEVGTAASLTSMVDLLMDLIKDDVKTINSVLAD